MNIIIIIILIPLILLTVLFMAEFVSGSLNDKLEKEYIDNADCSSLKHYVDAGNDGKDFFAVWTYETQKTINFRITEVNIDYANLKYQSECKK